VNKLAGLPKKYAKLGFKKGWAKYRASKRKPKRRSINVARRKSKKKRSSSRSKSMKVFGIDVVKNVFMPGIYGAGRQKMAEYVVPFARKLPGADKFGNVVDEVGMIGAAALVRKFVKNKTVRELATNAIRVESAQIGQALVSGSLGLGGTSEKKVNVRSFR